MMASLPEDRQCTAWSLQLLVNLWNIFVLLSKLGMSMVASMMLAFESCSDSHSHYRRSFELSFWAILLQRVHACLSLLLYDAD